MIPARSHRLRTSQAPSSDQMQGTAKSSEKSSRQAVACQGAHVRLGSLATEMVVRATSASLIGHLGSSTFRLSTTTVSMSRAGSCFSSESAPGPFHHGIRGRGGTIFTAALPSDDGRYKRTCELTSSIVPRGTSFHGLVELEFSPIAFGDLRLS